jgi:hypothetical protein
MKGCGDMKLILNLLEMMNVEIDELFSDNFTIEFRTHELLNEHKEEVIDLCHSIGNKEITDIIRNIKYDSQMSKALYLAEELNRQYRLESLDIVFVLKEILMLRLFMY